MHAVCMCVCAPKHKFSTQLKMSASENRFGLDKSFLSALEQKSIMARNCALPK